MLEVLQTSLETVLSWTPFLALLVIVALVACLFVIPLVHEWRRSRLSHDGTSRYMAALRPMVEHFFVMTAVFLSVVVVIVAVNNFLSPKMVEVELPSMMLSFFGLVFSAMAIIAGFLGWRLKRQVDELQEVEVRASQFSEAGARNWVACADLVLMQLPPITWTQQVPLEVLTVLRGLDAAFLQPALRGQLELAIEQSQNGARIRFARGLYRLTSGAGRLFRARDLEDGLHPETADPTAIELLRYAVVLADNGSSIALRRDIRLRAFQAYRQLPESRYWTAGFNFVEGIVGLPESQHRKLRAWAKIVVCLQMGYALRGEAARKQFKLALDEVDDLWANARKLFDESNEQGAHATLLYYCAKACWAHVFAGGALTSQQTAAGMAATKRAIAFLRQRVREETEDCYMSAVYNSCLAYTIIASNAVAELRGDEELVGDTSIGDYLATAREQVEIGESLTRAEFDLQLPMLIYNDHKEQMTLPVGFREDYLDRLDAVVSAPQDKRRGMLEKLYRD